MSRENEPLLEPKVLDDRPGPARPLSEAESAELVRRAFARSGFGGAGLRRVIAVAAAFLVLVGAAGAWAYFRKSRELRPVPTAAPLPPAPPAKVASNPPPPSVVLETSLPADAPHRSPAPPSRHEAVTPVETDLLRRANQLRAERKWPEAERIYAGIVRASPKSEDAAVASVAAASLRLEHLGDPKGALALYQKALRSAAAAPLAEEAAYGIAQSYRALGQRSDERRSLESFIRLHPASVLVPEAKDRLGALDR